MKEEDLSKTREAKERVITIELSPGRCNNVTVEMRLERASSGTAMAGLLSTTPEGCWIGG